jgi:uncharacterized membrane protein
MNLILVLRFIHVVSAIFWSGSAFLMAFFVAPSVRATADAGQKFMAYLVTQARITNAITVAAILTVLAGIALYGLDSGGFSSAWVKSSAGIGFGIGGAAGILAFIFGAIFGKNIAALGALFSNIQGKPTPEQVGQLQGIQKQLAIIGPIHTVVQIIAITCMATARYWHF